jgi:hypothetical protein
MKVQHSLCSQIWRGSLYWRCDQHETCTYTGQHKQEEIYIPHFEQLERLCATDLTLVVIALKKIPI